MNLQHYLQRIGFHGSVKPDLATLCQLQQAHVCTVPFENIDVQFGRPLTTGIEDAYKKIVTNRRGGWCYEQNGLFGWALSEIGYQVTRLSGSVMRQQYGDASDGKHLCLLEKPALSDKEFLVDVGFGGSMIRPMALEDSEERQTPFGLGLRRLDDHYWRFWENSGNGEFGFDFTTEAASEQSLSNKCRFLQSDPSSSFVVNLVAQLRCPDQHRILRGRVFTVVTANDTCVQTIDSADALVTTLADKFGLSVPEVADLWPKITRRHREIQNG